MKRKYIAFAIITFFSSLFIGCGTQTNYGFGQGYQRYECQSIPDNFERNNCLRKVDASYEKLKQETKYGNN